MTLAIETLRNIDETIESLASALAKGSTELHLASHLRTHETEFNLEALAPYFGVLWPAAVALADFLAAKTIATNAKVLEMGAGLGLPSLVLAKTSQTRDERHPILVTDLHPDVETFLQMNARNNQVESQIRFLSWDWRNAPQSTDWQNTFDVIIASDVIYEFDLITPLLKAIQHCLKPDGLAWIADPGRIFMSDFEKICAQFGFEIKREEVSPDESFWPALNWNEDTRQSKNIFIFQLRKLATHSSNSVR